MFSRLKALFRKSGEKKPGDTRSGEERKKVMDELYRDQENPRNIAWNGMNRDARRSHPGGGPV